jgi:hypothetical protein
MWRTMILATAVLGFESAPDEPKESNEWPATAFDTTECDFGTIPMGCTCRKTITITNRRSDLMQLQLLSRSWQECWVRKPEKTALMPGESTKLDVWITTSRWRTGDVKSRLDLGLFGAESASFSLTFTRHVRKDLFCHPGWFDLGALKQGCQILKTIHVTHFGDSEWKVTSASCISELLDLSLKETERVRVDDGRTKVQYAVTVSLRPDTPLSEINARVTLETNDEEAEQIELLVDGVIAKESELKSLDGRRRLLAPYDSWR